MQKKLNSLKFQLSGFQVLNPQQLQYIRGGEGEDKRREDGQRCISILIPPKETTTETPPPPPPATTNDKGN